MNLTRTRYALRRLTGSARRARWAAQVLDEVVDARAASVPRLPEDSRRRSADYLAELAVLADHYRRFADGVVSHRELHRRGERTLACLELVDEARSEQFVERG